MVIDIKYEAHMFSEEKLRDDYFERGECIHGREIVEILDSARKRSFKFEYSEETTLMDLVNAVKHNIGVDREDMKSMPLRYSFIRDGERYYIDNPEKDLIPALKHITQSDGKTVAMCILLSCDAGTVQGIDPLRFYFNSRESGSHNKPHVHVRDTQYRYNASISLEDGEVLAGKLPKKLAKLAKEKIIADREFYLKCWNTMTDGLKVDVDHHNKAIGY